MGVRSSAQGSADQHSWHAELLLDALQLGVFVGVTGGCELVDEHVEVSLVLTSQESSIGPHTSHGSISTFGMRLARSLITSARTSPGPQFSVPNPPTWAGSSRPDQSSCRASPAVRNSPGCRSSRHGVAVGTMGRRMSSIRPRATPARTVTSARLSGMIDRTGSTVVQLAMPPRAHELGARPVLVYLDQWCWDRLAKDRAGRPHEPSEAGAHAFLHELALEGVVAFPLSANTYRENWTRSPERTLSQRRSSWPSSAVSTRWDPEGSSTGSRRRDLLAVRATCASSSRPSRMGHAALLPNGRSQVVDRHGRSQRPASPRVGRARHQ